ncbi:hypothetical protein KP509_10G054500 [Ceratopteris richardii]|nr:hypothetical protein KP509_10G054500 [Ceratopteris richardii]
MTSAFSADLDTKMMGQAQLEATLAPTAQKPSEFPTEVAKRGKIEPKEEIQDESSLSVVWSKQEPISRPELDIVLSGANDAQERRMDISMLSSAKQQVTVYNNGMRQSSVPASERSSPFQTKVDLPSGDSDKLLVSSSATAHIQSSDFTGSGLATGPVRKVKTEAINGAGAGDDRSYDMNIGTTAGLSRSIQREVTPMADSFSRPPAASERSVQQQQYHGDGGGGGGGGMLFVGDLNWWTTDAELEAALLEYGRVKNLKFYEERVSGKSKGYCQVEFYDHASAVACKQGMNGRQFHGRPCIVALGNAKSIQQMGLQQERKAQAQFQAQQEQTNSRRSSTTGGTRGGPYQDRDSGRGYGRSRSQGGGGKSGQGGRGRGSYMSKGMGGGGTGGPYGQGHPGPMGGHQSAMMIHQGMMGQSYDPTYGSMGARGSAAYGGYMMPGSHFPGMVPPFPGMGPGGLPGVAPHVNPAFFGRPAGMALMPGSSMEGPHQGMWGDAALGGWGGEEHDRRARDENYVEDGSLMDYNYSTEIGPEKSRQGGVWEKENGGFSERHRRDDRDGEWERDSYKEHEGDLYRDHRDRDRFRERDDDWDRERTGKSRSKSRFIEDEDDPRQRFREGDYGRKRRMTEREL